MVERDATDHFRFSPVQTKLAQQLCRQYQMPSDVSTAVLLDESGGHVRSDAVLRLFQYMTAPYPLLGFILLLVFPKFLRDFGYSLFAKHRGSIWKVVKKVSGIGDTKMEPYRKRVLGLEEPIEKSWGFKTRRD